MLDYPPSFPADAAQLVVDHRGGVNNVSCQDAAQACWNLCGYVRGQQDKQNPAPPTPAPQAQAKPALTEDQAVAELKALAAGHKSAQTATYDWAGLLLALIALFQKLAA